MRNIKTSKIIKFPLAAVCSDMYTDREGEVVGVVVSDTPSCIEIFGEFNETIH